MRAGAYQRVEPANCCNCGPGAPSMTSDGCEGASVAKKKSGPRPAQAVPSLRSLGSKVAVMASRKLGLFDLASSINCGAVNFSSANADAAMASVQSVTRHAKLATRIHVVLGIVETALFLS